MIQSQGACISRRQILSRTGLGFGAVALHCLMRLDSARGLPGMPSVNERGSEIHRDFAARPAQFPPRAKAVIMLMQNGGPSQMDLFDPKPALARLDGQRHPVKVEMFQAGSESNKLLKSPFQFVARGGCGMELSEVIPHIGSVADDLTLVRSMVSEHNNHTEALVMMNTGKIFPGRPALGSWVSYALGSENQNLPGYIVLRDPEGYNTSGTLLWQNAWLPAIYRGTEVNTRGTPIVNLQARAADGSGQLGVPDGVREQLELIARLNERHRERFPGEPELEARIRNYELAARMQLAAADLLDMSHESPATRSLYGLDNPMTEGYGLRCLMARRLVEAGVRFVQVFPPVKPQFQPWDAHRNVKEENEAICARCDQPSAALIKDLKSRGLLDQTIVLWTGEFGRLPVSQNGAGRDHNRNAFSLILAGGGFKRGHVHGATDDVGYRAVDGRVTVPDLHATILYQLGFDHARLTYEHQGREETPTDADVTAARVVHSLRA